MQATFEELLGDPFNELANVVIVPGFTPNRTGDRR